MPSDLSDFKTIGIFQESISAPEGPYIEVCETHGQIPQAIQVKCAFNAAFFSTNSQQSVPPLVPPYMRGSITGEQVERKETSSSVSAAGK